MESWIHGILWWILKVGYLKGAILGHKRSFGGLVGGWQSQNKYFVIYVHNNMHIYQRSILRSYTSSANVEFCCGIEHPKSGILAWDILVARLQVANEFNGWVGHFTVSISCELWRVWPNPLFGFSFCSRRIWFCGHYSVESFTNAFCPTSGFRSSSTYNIRHTAVESSDTSSLRQLLEALVFVSCPRRHWYILSRQVCLGLVLPICALVVLVANCTVGSVRVAYGGIECLENVARPVTLLGQSRLLDSRFSTLWGW